MNKIIIDMHAIKTGQESICKEPKSKCNHIDMTIAEYMTDLTYRKLTNKR